MAVIARNARLVVLAAFATFALQAADNADIRATLGTVANALTANDPSSAMEPFSKSFAKYDKLRDYFTGLTAAFSIVNEVDVLDQQDSQATVRWAITLASNGSNHSTHRAAEIHLRMAREKKKWKIVDFSPIDLFDPAQAQTPSSK